MSEREDTWLARTRERWLAIDWEQTIDPSRLLIPEAHYMEVDSLGLDPGQRAALNHLFVCFTCELFVHFEAYVILYLERHADRVPFLTPDMVARFIAEERVHSEMFLRLLNRVRPDLYPSTGDGVRLAFLTWSSADERAVDLAPVGSFFLLAWLFEEITLHVPQAMDACPAESSPLVRDVMRLHANDERPHVSIDARVLEHVVATQSRSSVALQTVLTIPLLAFVDSRVKRASRRVARLAERELRLTSDQAKMIQERGPSQSDRWGIEAFRAKLEASDIAGSSVLRRALTL